MASFQIITKFRRLKDVVFLRPDSSPPQDGDVVTYVLAQDKLFLDAPTGGGGGTDDQTAAEVPFTPAGNLAATDVQAALEELDTEKAAAASAVMDGDAAGGVLSGTYPSPGFAVDMATQAELDAGVAAAEAYADGAVATSEAGQVRDGDAAGGVLSGTYPNPGFAADMATQAELDTHAADTTSVHGIADTSALLDTGDIGVAVQAYDADLTTIAGLSPTNDDVIQRKAGAWTNRTLAQLLTDLGALGTTFQPLDSDLTAIAALSTTVFGRSLLTQADAAATLTTLGVSAFIQTLLDDADAATARATLGLTGAQRRIAYLEVGDPNGDAVTTGDGKRYFHIPAELNGMNLIRVELRLTTVSSSGLPTYQIARDRGGTVVDMLSTKVSVDANEKTSTTATTSAVIDATKDDVATDDILRLDKDVAGTGELGDTVILTFEAP